MQKSKKKIESIPDKFRTIMEASDFWDTHDASDYWNKTRKAEFKVSLKKEPKYIILEEDIAKKVFNIAKKKHIAIETLINIWLKERLYSMKHT
ncbi:MAG: CopG family antitoxin [Nitrospinota bacterium]